MYAISEAAQGVIAGYREAAQSLAGTRLGRPDAEVAQELAVLEALLPIAEACPPGEAVDYMAWLEGTPWRGQQGALCRVLFLLVSAQVLNIEAYHDALGTLDAGVLRDVLEAPEGELLVEGFPLSPETLNVRFVRRA